MRITVIDYFKDIEDIIGITAKSTQSLFPPSELEIDQKDIDDMLKYTVEHKLSSVLDFPYYIIEIYGVSRSFTHQWVRHRLSSHMQQSLRYVKIIDEKVLELYESDKRIDLITYVPKWFVIPPSILISGKEAIIKYIEAMINSSKAYLELLNYKIPEGNSFNHWFLTKNREYIPKEDARFALPIGTKTFVTTAADAEEWLHIMKVRCCMDAQWEIRITAWTIGFLLYLLHPRIFYRFGPWCIQERCRGFSIKRDPTCIKNIFNLKETLKEISNKIREHFINREDGEIETPLGRIKFYIENKKWDFFTIDLTDIFGYRTSEEIKKEVIDYFESQGIKLDKNLLDFEVIGRIRYI
ncbi:NEQ015 [Nanoarchaeum equitans Kin4-M]|uniref:FAD-dependent thymidylate synthase n=1 Tax=Nanoarchaeum equitans (strain Kin4-M) TaxID=228908 RepID=Q74N47_NANEQ|nr:NEQ015 [Nanoarchaeum equitans Kin4-M]